MMNLARTIENHLLGRPADGRLEASLGLPGLPDAWRAELRLAAELAAGGATDSGDPMPEPSADAPAKLAARLRELPPAGALPVWANRVSELAAAPGQDAAEAASQLPDARWLELLKINNAVRRYLKSIPAPTQRADRWLDGLAGEDRVKPGQLRLVVDDGAREFYGRPATEKVQYIEGPGELPDVKAASKDEQTPE